MKNQAQNDTFPIFLLGVLSGSIFFAVLIVAFRIPLAEFCLSEIKSTDFATLIAGFGGAFVGGLISWVLAKQTAKDTMRRDEADRISVQKALSISLLLKTQQIANGYYTQRQYLWDALNAANDKGQLQGELWRWVKPQIGGSHPTPTYEAQEFMPLVLAGRSHLIDECQMLALRYNVLEMSFITYSNKREKLQEILAPYTVVVGADGQMESKIPLADKPRIELMIVELESIVHDIYKYITNDCSKATELCRNLSMAYDEYFGSGGFVKLKVDAD